MAAGYHIEEIVQVIDLGGVSTLSLMAHQRSHENQAELQHNQDFNPETLVRLTLPRRSPAARLANPPHPAPPLPVLPARVA